MINMVIYNISDGNILRCVTCPEEMADIQFGAGEAWIEHEKVDDTQFKVNLETGEIFPA
jgi:hypothetical protein